MHGRIRPAVLALTLAGSIAAMPSVLEGQPRDWAISPRVGFAIPINDLGRPQGSGYSVGLGVERIVERTSRRDPMWAVRADLGLDRLPGSEAQGTSFPSMSLVRVALGIEYWVPGGSRTSASLRLKGGGGGTLMRTAEQPADGLEIDELIPTIYAGVTGGLGVFFVDAQWTLLLAGPRLTGKFPVRGSFRTLQLLRLGAGVRIPL